MACGRITATGNVFCLHWCIAGADELCYFRSYEQYCDLSRQYDRDPSPSVLPDGTRVPPYKGPGVDTFVAEFGRLDMLDYSMATFL